MPNRSAEQKKEYLEQHRFKEILSVETGSHYLDTECSAYIFEDSGAADAFVNEHAGTAAGSEVSIDFDSYVWRLWCLGIKKLIINGDEKESLPIRRANDIRSYSNPDLTRDVSLLLETSSPEYLKNLGKRKFIVPAVVTTIETRDIKKPYITFSVLTAGKVPNADKQPVLYVAFTDLDHYTAWRLAQNELYSPVEMEFWQFRQVFGESGIAINPGEDGALLLLPDLVSMIEETLPEVSYFSGEKPAKESEESAAAKTGS